MSPFAEASEDRCRQIGSFSYGLRIERWDIGSYADHNESEPDPGRTRGERSLSAGPIVILCICVDPINGPREATQMHEKLD